MPRSAPPGSARAASSRSPSATASTRSKPPSTRSSKNTAEIFRREILPKIKDGVYHYEDYIEADGVDEPQLHALRLTMTKTPEKIVLDFNGTDPEAKGPINWALDEVEGRYFRKWLAPTLRSLAASPERAAEIDSNEGVLDVVEVVFPPKGTLITPNFGKPTGMRFFLMLRSLGVFAACLSKATGGRMPADHETIRIWGLTGGRTARTSTSSARCSAAAVRAGPGPTARTSSTSCRIRRTCRRNSPRRATRS